VLTKGMNLSVITIIGSFTILLINARIFWINEIINIAPVALNNGYKRLNGNLKISKSSPKKNIIAISMIIRMLWFVNLTIS